jgi:hypothetical protein
LSIPYTTEAPSMPEKIISLKAWVLTVAEAFIMRPMELDSKPFKEINFNHSWTIKCLRFIEKDRYKFKSRPIGLFPARNSPLELECQGFLLDSEVSRQKRFVRDSRTAEMATIPKHGLLI